jgi:tetratricopeptide (TPR) repeat protein
VRRSLSFAALFFVVFGIWRYTADLSVARAEAEERRAQAEDLINFMVGDLRGKLEPVQRLDILDDVAEKALKYVRSSKLESASAEELIAQVQALNQLGDVRISQGNLPGAMTLFRQSLERATVAVQREPKNPEATYALALSRFWLANGYRLQDQPARAMEHARIYLALTTGLAEKHPANDKYVLESAYAHSQTGMLLEDQRDLKGAIAEFQRTLAIKEAYSARRPDDDVAKEDIARTMNKLAFAMQKNGDLRTALRYFENEVALREELVRRNPRQIRWKQDLAVSHSFLAWALEDLGHPEDALKQRLADVTVHEELVAHDPANKTWKRNLVRGQSSLGRLVGLNGELAEAERYLRAAEEGIRALAEAEPARASHRGDLARVKAHYARVLLANGKADAAGVKAAEAIEACGSDAANRAALGYAWLVQGNVQERQGRNAAARDSWTRAAELLRPGSANSSNVRELENWARVLIALDRRKEAADVVTRLRVLGFRYQDFEALCQSRGY